MGWNSDRDKRVFIEGKATPSARPKRARATKSMLVEWSAAHGVNNVAKDHKATPQAITLFPPYLSANAPPKIDDNVYPHRNDDCIHPYVHPSKNKKIKK